MGGTVCEMTDISYATMDTPIGALFLLAQDFRLTEIRFQTAGQKAPDESREPSSSVLDEAVSQLRAYFSGELREFDLPLAPEGTPFQKKVWGLLLDIPYGETRSYGELARRLNSSARAVGRANGRNPVADVFRIFPLLFAR